MTTPDSQASASDETGRPEAPSGRGLGQDGWTPDSLLFDAFISYSRTNLDVADKIERDLEKFPLPRAIRNRLGRRHLNVFRDVSDMTGNRLDPALEHNLEQSRTLVVLCSPAARRSRYVGMEINRFAQLREAEKIVPVLVAGGPNNDPTVDAAEWAFPDALGDVLGSDPLAADLRHAWSTTGRKAKLARGSPWVQLVAGIVGATTDDLTDRIAKAERRRLQSIVAILVVVLAVVTSLGVVALNQRNNARDQRDRAVAAKLVVQSQAILGGVRVGGDRRAILQMLAAEVLAPGSDPDALLNTVIDERRLVKIIATPSYANDVAVSPDGRWMVSAGDDHMIRRWDYESGNPVGDPLAGHTDSVSTVAYSRDGRWIASGGTDNTARVWDANTGAEVHVLKGHDDYVSSVAFSPDGSLLASAGRDGTVRLWNAATGDRVGEPIRAHNGWVFTVEFSPNGSRLASGGDDGAVRLWDVGTRELADPLLPTDAGRVADVEFSRDGRRIASVTQVLNLDQRGSVTFSDGAMTSGTGSRLHITELDSGRPVVDGLTEFGYEATSLAFSPDGKHVAVGADDAKIRVWDADTGAAAGAPLTGHTESVTALAYSRDGTTIISSGDASLHLWAADPDRSIGKRLPGMAADVLLPTAVSPDGLTVATQDPENQSDIALWRAETGDDVRTIAARHAGPITALAWRSDGQVIASSGAVDSTIRIWNAETGEPVGLPLTRATAPIVVLAFSPDGRRIASGSQDGSAWLWDMTDSPPHRQPLPGHEHGVGNVEFSADGHRLMTMSPMLSSGDSSMTASSVRVWDANTGQLAGTPVAGRGGHPVDLAGAVEDAPILAAALSPNGQRILVSTIHELRLRDVATGQPVGEPWIEEQKLPIMAVAFSPDGRYLVSADVLTARLQLWDVQTGRPVGRPLQGHAALIGRVAFGAEGNSIVSGGVDGWMTWPGPGNWRDELCDKLTSNMTRAEWDEWVSPTIEYRKACPSLPEPD